MKKQNTRKTKARTKNKHKQYISKWPQVREILKKQKELEQKDRVLRLMNTSLEQLMKAFLVGDYKIDQHPRWEHAFTKAGTTCEFAICEYVKKNKVKIHPQVTSAVARLGFNAVEIAKDIMCVEYMDGTPACVIEEFDDGAKQVLAPLGAIEFICKQHMDKKFNHFYA